MRGDNFRRLDSVLADVLSGLRMDDGSGANVLGSMLHTPVPGLGAEEESTGSGMGETGKRAGAEAPAKLGGTCKSLPTNRVDASRCITVAPPPKSDSPRRLAAVIHLVVDNTHHADSASFFAGAGL
jgi:hypothetical protein